MSIRMDMIMIRWIWSTMIYRCKSVRIWPDSIHRPFKNNLAKWWLSRSRGKLSLFQIHCQKLASSKMTMSWILQIRIQNPRSMTHCSDSITDYPLIYQKQHDLTSCLKKYLGISQLSLTALQTFLQP